MIRPADSLVPPALVALGLTIARRHGDATYGDAMLAGRAIRYRHGLSLTPYASFSPCSAHCRFCSEDLAERSTRQAAQLRPGAAYHAQLDQLFAVLADIPLTLSLSGLEYSDHPAMLDAVTARASAAGLPRTVLYSNGNGFGQAGAQIRRCLQRFAKAHIECSRHHHREAQNQDIMRFGAHQPARSQATFCDGLQAMTASCPVDLVCLLQQRGIASIDALESYLDWAADLGVRRVIVRGLSLLDQVYDDNPVRRYIARERIDPLPLAVAAHGRSGWQLGQIHEGYYYWNVSARWGGRLDCLFEASDYGVMHRRHQEAVHKLVFFANGQLCAGWVPDRDVLWQADHGP